MTDELPAENSRRSLAGSASFRKRNRKKTELNGISRTGVLSRQKLVESAACSGSRYAIQRDGTRERKKSGGREEDGEEHSSKKGVLTTEVLGSLGGTRVSRLSADPYPSFLPGRIQKSHSSRYCRLIADILLICWLFDGRRVSVRTVPRLKYRSPIASASEWNRSSIGRKNEAHEP